MSTASRKRQSAAAKKKYDAQKRESRIDRAVEKGWIGGYSLRHPKCAAVLLGLVILPFRFAAAVLIAPVTSFFYSLFSVLWTYFSPRSQLYLRKRLSLMWHRRVVGIK